MWEICPSLQCKWAHFSMLFNTALQIWTHTTSTGIISIPKKQYRPLMELVSWKWLSFQICLTLYVIPLDMTLKKRTFIQEVRRRWWRRRYAIASTWLWDSHFMRSSFNLPLVSKFSTPFFSRFSFRFDLSYTIPSTYLWIRIFTSYSFKLSPDSKFTTLFFRSVSGFEIYQAIPSTCLGILNLPLYFFDLSLCSKFTTLFLWSFSGFEI